MKSLSVFRGWLLKLTFKSAIIKKNMGLKRGPRLWHNYFFDMAQ